MCAGNSFSTGSSRLCTRYVGVDGQHFNGHSFQIGAATSASQAGVLETRIKILGGWSNMAYHQYIRPSAPELATISKEIASQKPQQTWH